MRRRDEGNNEKHLQRDHRTRKHGPKLLEKKLRDKLCTKKGDATRPETYHDEDKFGIESKFRERKNLILDALETRYHKSGMGHLLFSEPSLRRRTRSMEGTWQRLSSATRTDETSVPEELPQDSRINTTTKVRPTVSVAKKYTEVHDTTMFYPNMNENIITTNDDGIKLS